VYVDSGDDYITAVDARDGRVSWRARTANRGAFANMLVTARYLYVPGGGNGLAVIDRRTGRIVADVKQPNADAYSHVATAPAEIPGGRIVINVKGAAWAFDEP
jgi:outer membrane protein assembly factor BamB